MFFVWQNLFEIGNIGVCCLIASATFVLHLYLCIVFMNLTLLVCIMLPASSARDKS